MANAPGDKFCGAPQSVQQSSLDSKANSPSSNIRADFGIRNRLTQTRRDKGGVSWLGDPAGMMNKTVPRGTAFLSHPLTALHGGANRRHQTRGRRGS